ncbi:uncharacterized protein LOC135959804 [Calliphora vicina]|uniref:uncharacterized protein LOC135959804 n=1 Tax=Calliphora vicina TaxID=7373 RepID=UPI00325C3175
MLALYSDISDQLKFGDNDFIIMDELNEISSALTSTSHLSVENERCTRLDSCQSPDQFFVNMVNEFLNDDTTTLPDETSKTSPLNIEYLEEPSDNGVESLINFHCLNKTTKIVASTSSSSSVSPAATTTTTGAFRINELTDDTKNINSLLLPNLNENLPRNVKEICYQRFGRFNTNLPAEVHNFKCHLCAFSCAWKEILLQHFQDKHPT